MGDMGNAALRALLAGAEEMSAYAQAAMMRGDGTDALGCPHEEAVCWNEHNKVVQCHRCGQQFISTSEVTSLRELLRVAEMEASANLAAIPEAAEAGFARGVRTATARFRQEADSAERNDLHDAAAALRRMADGIERQFVPPGIAGDPLNARPVARASASDPCDQDGNTRG